MIADLDILAEAPIELIRAGLGDALAKPLCLADWRLSRLMRDSYYCPLAAELVRELEPAYLDHAAAIGRRDHEAVAALMEALLYSGISMVIAGNSAPVSGAEHLISHTLDMRANLEGRTPSYHGEQVGVATLVTARIYERLMSYDSPDLAGRMRNMPAIPDDDRLMQQIRNFFGPRANTVIGQYGAKRLAPDTVRADRHRLMAQWDVVRNELRGAGFGSERLAQVMADAGAKTGYAELGLTRDEFRAAVYVARAIRPRYTVLDMAWELGMLDTLIEEVT